MTRRKLITAMVATTAVAAGAAVPVAGGATSRTVTIGVFDNYFTPTTKRVKVGTTVKWRWDKSATDVHDVALKSGPSGVKKFDSTPLAAGQTYRRKITKAGTYKIVCSLHDEMKMTVRAVR